MSAGVASKGPPATWRARLAALLVASSLWAACGRTTDAATPPIGPAARDGSAGELLFARGTAPDWELVLLDVASGEQRVLGAAAGACEPAWAPDGARLAFRAPHDGRRALATLAADGSDLRWLAPELSSFTPNWEPDGRGLIADAEPAPGSAPPAGTSPAPAASPASPGAGRPAIYRVAADGSVAPEKLAEGHAPLLSPDGLWVIVKRTSDAENLSVLHRPSGSLAPLSSAPVFTGLAFARAGDQLYLGRELATGMRQIVATTWPVIAWRQVTSALTDRLPAPSPDGRTLAFVRAEASAAPGEASATESVRDDVRDELFTRDLVSGVEKRWPLDSVRRSGETTLYELQWSADGTRLALTAGEGGLATPRRLLLLDVRDGSVRELFDAAPGQVLWPRWRPLAAAATLAEPAAK